MRHLVRLTLVLLALLMLYAVLGLASNNSPSEPRGLYRLTHEPLQRGRYVVLKMPLKQIAGVPGDTVRTAPEGSYVNGKLWPKSGIPAGVSEHFPFGTY